MSNNNIPPNTQVVRVYTQQGIMIKAYKDAWVYKRSADSSFTYIFPGDVSGADAKATRTGNWLGAYSGNFIVQEEKL